MSVKLVDGIEEIKLVLKRVKAEKTLLETPKGRQDNCYGHIIRGKVCKQT